MNPRHRIENRADMLAQRVIARRDALATMLRAGEDRPLFTTHKAKAEALAWWRTHRHDDLGKQVIERWYGIDPAVAASTVARLDGALADRVEGDRLMGGTQPVEVPAYAPPS